MAVSYDLGASETWTECDFHFYVRRSMADLPGNTSLAMQNEDVPAALVRTTGIPIADLPWTQFYEEEVSGADADVRLAFGQDGSLGLTGLKRGEFQRMLHDCTERYGATGRTQVICCFMLNRLGRSKLTVTTLELVANACDGNLLIWAATMPGRFLRPSDQTDRLSLWADIEMAGKQELKVKSDFVRNAKLRIARTTTDRSLSERAVGYRRYPCDVAGNRITALDDITKIDHYRLEREPSEEAIVLAVFEAVRDGIRPARIAGMVQERFGNHPKTGRRWTKHAVRWMLRNPLYTGRRLYNRMQTKEAGSQQRRRRPTKDWVYSEHDPTLQIISDTLFAAVQHQLAAWAGTPDRRGRKRSMGRPPKQPLYFHHTAILRCGICGHPLQVARQAQTYTYVCRTLTARGLPTCQGHPALAIDADIGAIMQEAFTNVTQYRQKLQRELRSARDAKQRAQLERQLATEEATLETMKTSLWTQMREAKGTVSSVVFDLLTTDIEKQAEKIEDLRNRLVRFGQTEVEKQKEGLLILTQGMEGFAIADFARRKALILQLIEAIYIWPDRKIWVHWKGTERDAVLAELQETLGRTVGEGLQWGSVDFVRLEGDLRRLMDEGEIPQEAFLDLVGSSLLYNWYVKRRGGITPQSLIVLYSRAIQQYLDMPRLRADVMSYLQQRQQAGATVYRLTHDLHLARRTVHRLLRGDVVLRETYVKVATQLGTLSQYQTLPEWTYLPESLPDLFAFIQGRRTAKRVGDPSSVGAEKSASDTSSAHYAITKGGITYAFPALVKGLQTALTVAA